jgi:23S rRNA pseudouridine1911/1915/1917 synthase
MPNDPRDGCFTVANGALPERLDRVLRGFRPGLSWRQVRDLVARGKVRVDGAVVTDAGRPVGGGAGIELRTSARSGGAATGLPPGSADPDPGCLDPGRIVFADPHLVVVDKPAGVDTVPFDGAGFDAANDAGAPALDAQLASRLGARVRIVHRLDRDTTGLLVFARTAEAEGRLAHQFRRHTVHRRYLAIAHGDVAAATIRTFLADDRGDGLRGSVADKGRGKEAITMVEPVEQLRGATLVACRPQTGRTHQIRIHLAERGHMLLGERGYVREHQGPALPAPRILLHAAELGFVHPDTGEPLRFSSPMPDDMAAVLARLRP